MVPYNELKSHQLPPFIKLRNEDGSEDVHYSIFYDSVPKEFEKVAQVELNETEEKKRQGMERLREILKEESISGVEDSILLCCLRKCKYNIQKSESQLLKYHKLREMVLDMLQEVDMKRLEHVLDHMVVGLLPYRDKKGRAIFFTTPNINFELFDLEDALLCFYVNLAFILSFPLSSITGVVYIADSKFPSMDILYPVLKLFRQKFGHFTSFPGRIAKLEVLNEIFIVRWTVNLIRPFVSSKTIERVNFCGNDVINLRKTYHPDLLPEEFGGTMGPLCNAFYKEELLNFMKKMKSERIA